MAWTTDSLVAAALDPEDDEHEAAVNLAHQLVSSTLLFYSRLDSEGYTAPDYDGEQSFVVFEPVLPTILNNTALLQYTMVLGDPQVRSSFWQFSEAHACSCT